MIYEIKTVDGVKTKVPLTGNGYGLPLGTWISYEGTCPDGFIESEQTFNTTTYAALYALLGTNKVPARFDHSVLSDWEQIHAETDTTAPVLFTADYDGYLHTQSNSEVADKQTGVIVRITHNGTMTMLWTCGRPYDGGGRDIFYQKGDTIQINGLLDGQETYTVFNAYKREFKRHLAIKATPAYVEPDTVSDMVNTLRTQDSYSLEEVNTGKKWIDGKPIYRKVFTGLNIATTSSRWFATNIDSSDIDCIVHSQMIGIDSNALYQENEFECIGMVAVNKNTKKLDIDTFGSVTVKKIAIEYTKTTD